jgi:predicted acylesterase/phospholipase RssA
MTQPLLECDLIMRGGIASGLVYPTAVAELSKSYRFRGIGGTSAGAIAAAATAAAEYSRRENTHSAPFKRLAAIPEELASRDDGRLAKSKLFRLFQAQRGTKPFYDLAVTFMESKKERIDVQFLKLLGTLFMSFPSAAILGALPGFAAAYFFLAHVPFLNPDPPIGPALWLYAALFVVFAAVLQLIMTLLFRGWSILIVTAAIVLLWLFGYFSGSTADELKDILYLGGAMLLTYIAAAGATLSSVFAAARRAQHQLPKNMYGMCSGCGPRRKDGTPQLTDWLHGLIQELAGRKPTDPPLTIADLKGVDGENSENSISIALMTTDVTRGTSHTYPQLEGVGHWRGSLYFMASELKLLFPESVVDWMVSKSGKPLDLVDEKGKPSDVTDVYRLPEPDDLPLLLGARMSMSFPFLLSSVPLYMPDKTDADEHPITLHKLWFSDGGLTSNFPIHFFDSMVPRRPTFGISLAYDDNVIKDEANARLDSFVPSDDWMKFGKYVMMPSTNHEGAFLFARFCDFDNSTFRLSGFFSALFDASRAWMDNELINMPGYRDRIVHVHLASNEGGYNLDMPAEVIQRIAKKGTLAGEMLAARFAPVPGVDPKTGRPIELTWDNHRWIRYRGLMAAFEELAKQFQERWKQAVSLPEHKTPSLYDLLEESSAIDKWFAYPWGDPGQFGFAKNVTEQLADFVKAWDAPYKTFDWENGRAPRPKLRLRVMPPDEAGG